MSAHQKFVVWFHEVDKHDIPVVGGKGANLGEMTQAKLPVPPGFIVTSSAYFHFIEHANLRPRIKKLLSDLDYNDTRKLQDAAKKVQQEILRAPIPKEIADTVISCYFKLSV